MYAIRSYYGTRNRASGHGGQVVCPGPSKSGSKHSSGVTDGERTRSTLSVSEVRFRAIDDGEIRRYVATGEPLDKAGAYGIQGRAAVFIDRITSYNVCYTKLLRNKK